MKPASFAHPGIVLIDKPGGMTSHDVVSRVRRALGTRKVGHAGTLDPMATGLLVLGVNAATRLLTFLVGLDKTYTATIRLGSSTTTDDAEGVSLGSAPSEQVERVSEDAILSGVASLTGQIDQVPSSVSAIKVDGKRAYARVRGGEQVSLEARPVSIDRFEVIRVRRDKDVIDVDVEVDCSSGTYIRALARDLGFRLGVGGHLIALRRTRIGPFAISDAVSPDLGAGLEQRLLDPADVAAQVFPVWRLSEAEAADLTHGRTRDLRAPATGRLAAVDHAGRLRGVVTATDKQVTIEFNMPQEDA